MHRMKSSVWLARLQRLALGRCKKINPVGAPLYWRRQGGVSKGWGILCFGLVCVVLPMVSLSACDTPNRTTPPTTAPARMTVTATTGLTTTTPVTITAAPTSTANITPTQPLTPGQGLTVTATLTASAAITSGHALTVATAGVWGIPESKRTMRATELLGHPIQNQQREDVGQVTDLLIDWSSGRVLYVMVGHGGLLNLGQTILPMPLAILRYQSDHASFTLDMADATLQAAPSFAADTPMMTDAQFQQDVATFWSTLDGALLTRTLQTGDLSPLPKELLYSSALIGSAVQNFQGESVGQVQDVMLDLGTGTVSYAVLSFGGFLGIGDKLFAIPLKAFEFDATALARSTAEQTKPTLRLDINEEALAAAPGFDPDAYPDTAAPQWDAEIRRYWH